MKKIRRGFLEISAGLLLLALACCFYCHNIAENERAGAASEVILAAVRLEIRNPAAPPTQAAAPSSILSTEKKSAPCATANMLGILEIPALSLTLPVQAEYSEELLKSAPCRYRGEKQEISKFLICAHNYRNHFGSLWALSPGDEVRFTDMEGNLFEYSVSEASTIAGDDFAALEEGDWELALLTCTPSLTRRVLIRCRLE